MIDNPAPDNDASVRSLGIFLCKSKTSDRHERVWELHENP